MPRQGSYTPAEAEAVLEDFVFPKECASSPFPTDFSPNVVSTFIGKRLTSQPRAAITAGRATKLVRFYVLRDRLDQLKGLLTGGEKKPDELARTCHLIVALSELGDPGQQQAAVKEFERLLPDRVAELENGFEVLIKTFFSLPPKAASTALRKRVADARTDCERNGPPQRLGFLMECDARLLPWVLGEKARKDALLAKPPGPERLLAWTEAYFGFDNTKPFKWDQPAGFALLADARDQGDPAAVTALKAAMAKIDPAKFDAEQVKFYKTRGYRAREYFLDQLNEDEQHDAQSHERAQEDLIA